MANRETNLDAQNNHKIQLRSEEKGLEFASTFDAAHKICRDKSYWKMSFEVEDAKDINGVDINSKKESIRYRLLRNNDDTWENHPFVVSHQKPYCSDDKQPIDDRIRDLLIEAGFKLC